MNDNRPVFVALTRAGATLARRAQTALGVAEVHGLAARVDDADATFDDVSAHLRALFAAGRPIIGMCAAGILIRALAPLLADKHDEPPVVALAEDGSAVVPLIGGHRGANDLARALATALGGAAAITTASDVAFGLAFDRPPAGWRIANPDAVKPIAAALLAGERVALSVQAGDAAWLVASGIDFAPAAALSILVTDRDVPGAHNTLVYHPPVLALGVGGERGVDADEIEALARATLAARNLSPHAIACVVSIDIKEDEPAIHALARTLGVPARFFPADRLAAEEQRLANPSEIVRAAVGVAGVAESAALAAAGSEGALVAPKAKSARATCAVARSPRPLDPAAIGRARAELAVVGIGPGDAGWRTPEVDAAIMGASDIVGYGLYLDLLGSAIAGKARHESALGAEEARARLALDLAAEGRRVALVSSGDAGIYGLAALVFELIERGDNPAWRRAVVRVCPGVSAMQAAAARAGAPLGHDFCAISLSDLLTPWADIEKRLVAACTGDFVLALYNPASGRRRDLLDRARALLLGFRGADAPVALARNLGRDGERVDIVRLGDAWTERVDMLTLVLVGSRQTRIFAGGDRKWMFTPRGYAAKSDRDRRRDGP
ncbi:MAG: precorrin-3B C(17)-methyltransferase [Rhodospirillales bacterium]|nr:precorrin-3B C(17)-methyltransferase [Rhodospirillales bacterium]